MSREESGVPPPGRTAATRGGASLRWQAGTAIIAAVFGSMPAFLTGAMAVLVRRELQFGESGLGLAVSAFFGTAAVLSVPAGRMVERIGGYRGMLLGGAGTAFCMVAIGAFAHTWGQLVGLLVLGGASLAVTQPASNLALAQAVRFGRQGLAFGAKQSAVPAATLAAGAALPLVGLALGWRVGFVGMAGLTLLLVLALTLRPFAPARRTSPAPHGDAAPRRLALLAVGAGFGMAAGNSLGSFYVEFAVAARTPVATAGGLLVVGSLLCIVARLTWGWLADRRDGNNLPFMMVLMTMGAGAYLALGAVRSFPLMVAATLLAFATAWGWPGLMLYTTVRLSRSAPASATAIVLSGAFVGGTLGPVSFGFLVERGSYTVAWSAAAAYLLLAAGALWVARRALRGDRERQLRAAVSGSTA